MVLNVSSEFMRDHFKESKENEFICEHKIDVVKPIIIFLHSLCFQMPKTYDLDFADRLLKAIDFFEPVQKEQIYEFIDLSLSDKFCKESVNFDQLLQCLQISIQHQFYYLHQMSWSLIANKYYYKWIDTFPPNACNPENPLFCDIFGPEGHIDLENEESLTYRTFDLIKKTFDSSLFTNLKTLFYYYLFNKFYIINMKSDQPKTVGEAKKIVQQLQREKNISRAPVSFVLEDLVK
uniref:Uncharacterized protein n=1 Tax=Panagrolaimus davidi TaxID=227884 RepID=A0A914QAV8_9BILA